MKFSATSVAVKRPWRLRISRNTVVEIISSLLILLFMYAAISKLLEYKIFELQLSKSPFITEFAPLTAWSLPVGEILVALGLSIRKTRVLSLYVSLFFMTMFTAYIYAMLNYSYDIPCSCGGILSKMGWEEHFWFNVGFILLSILGILLTNLERDKKNI